jgi:DNA anti-recombination protein RmuC
MAEKKKSAEAVDAKDLGVGQGASTEKLERIREIVFGAQMREYSQRFENLQRDMARLQQELQRLTEQLGEQGRQQAKQVREVDDRLAAKLQEQSRQLTQQVTELDNRQSAQLRDADQRLGDLIAEIDKRFNQKAADIDTKFSQRSDDLQNLMRDVEDSIRTDLRDNTETLGAAKVDRLTLGDLLVQMGKSLREREGDGIVWTCSRNSLTKSNSGVRSTKYLMSTPRATLALGPE